MESFKVFSLVGMLIFGTLSSIFSKIVYQTEGKDLNGHTKLFRKPWATTSLMFLAMAFCLPIGAAVRARKRRQQRRAAEHDSSTPLLDSHHNGGDGEEKHTSIRSILMLALPMAFDLVATLLMSVGLLYVTASIYQMLRGAEILFSALFAVTFLHRPLNKLHYLGIAACTVGIVVVGSSSFLGSGDKDKEAGNGMGGDASQVLLGMLLIIVAQAMQAAQVTMEDYAMSSVKLEPLTVVGIEGLLGTAALFLVLMPIVQFLPGPEGEGIHEDSLESLHMLTHSIPRWAIPAVLAANSLTLLGYNVAGMFVTSELGAVTRTVFESARTLFVWLGDLLLFYTPLGLNGKLGEAWDRSSYVQAAGFAVLVTGTLVYARGDQKEEDELRAKHSHHRPVRAVPEVTDYIMSGAKAEDMQLACYVSA
ncbi:hypothetical protein WJX81_000335 [Elliptochloris bilobata]|uniref:EamA domain-containing protein n=1 Tax=Elliptochloris bilobata TaxID=381761 RepID=A0AAW1SDN3_9CHLO